ncbi:MAG: hypothetical protein ABSG69_01980 [Candidatus Acidiferrum sp.]
MGTVASIYGYLTLTVNHAVIAPAPVTIFATTAPLLVWVAALAGALIALGTVFGFYYERCLSKPDTEAACSAGVVEDTVPAFNSTTDTLFPFTAQHNRVDVVVKCTYWSLLTTNAAWVWCNTDPDKSPMIRCYYKTSAVCDAGLGATIGGAAGAFLGTLIAATVGAAIGCATVILCIFAILVALLIAAAAVLVASFAGGQIGRQLAGSSSPTTAAGNTVMVGDYITTCGGSLTSGDDNGSRVYWFVDTTIQHGSSSASAPFDHTDPDTHLNPDACPSCSAQIIQ